MAVKVLFNVFTADETRFEREYDADNIVSNPERPGTLDLLKGGALVAVIESGVILAAVIERE